MKKVLALSLFAICLTSCGSSQSLSSEPYMAVSMWQSSSDSHITLYDGLSYSYITFKGDIARMVQRSDRNDSKKYEDSIIACTYFNASEGLIFTPNYQWFELYDGMNEKQYEEYTGTKYDVSFKKPEKDRFEFRVWGQHGNGWIETYTDSSSNGIVIRNLYVTKSYAKKVGIGITEYKYDSAKGEYVIK